MREIVLASASKRRSQILSSCGIPHKISISGAEEILDEKKAVHEIVEENARVKAETIASGAEDSIVIGADTLVAHDEDILGKPGDEDAARNMLKRFSGTDVEVYTGLCVIDTSTGRKAAGFEKSSLEVASLTDEEVERYFLLLGPYDKAGGFSIEGIGALLFDSIKGSYFNILGLPMMKLRELFGEIGLDILDYVEK
ncbi:MAG: Maf family protein [Candidatus Omnitrophota bacterium]